MMLCAVGASLGAEEEDVVGLFSRPASLLPDLALAA